ncbi:MAG: molybdenum cofactor guanylyltransferase, partial [Raoultibacter sp.]
ERVSPVADDFIVTTNEAENLGFLHTDYPELGIRLIPDVYDFRGALPGIYSALQAAKNPYVAIVACDMLCASPSLIAREVIAMDQSGADVVVPVNNHGYEPFHALYRRDVCREAIKEALSQGSRRAQSFFDSVNVCELPQSEVLKAEPMGGCFINANTPEELHLMEKAFFEE